MFPLHTHCKVRTHSLHSILHYNDMLSRKWHQVSKKLKDMLCSWKDQRWGRRCWPHNTCRRMNLTQLQWFLGCKESKWLIQKRPRKCPDYMKYKQTTLWNLRRSRDCTLCTWSLRSRQNRYLDHKECNLRSLWYWHTCRGHTRCKAICQSCQ